jgi:hypothetical protein
MHLVGRLAKTWFNGFSGDVFLNIDPGIFQVWDPSNQLQADMSSNLPLKLLKKVACELENTPLRFERQTLCD